MSLEFGDEETDHLLAAADEHLLDVVDESQPPPPMSPKLLGAVVRTLTSDKPVLRAWHLQKGA